HYSRRRLQLLSWIEIVKGERHRIGIKKGRGRVAFFAKCHRPLPLVSLPPPLFPFLQLLSWIRIVEGGRHQIEIEKERGRFRVKVHSPSSSLNSPSFFNASPSALPQIG
ncbi:hypothetical protein BHE74_00047964, partial [Ensete ventricosum]